MSIDVGLQHKSVTSERNPDLILYSGKPNKPFDALTDGL